MRVGFKNSFLMLLNTVIFAGAGCTGQVPFRFIQQEEAFSSQLQVNTKIDLLWVVDNSSSMDVSQEKLRTGFKSFAEKYLKPTWDIRIAVITTDTYMANSAFTSYLNTIVPGSDVYVSDYIKDTVGLNLSDFPFTVHSDGTFPNGFTYRNLSPKWGTNYAKLLPNIHDGPITTLCLEAMPYFFLGATQCAIRDNKNLYTGTSHCLIPDTDQGESGISQCVNTVLNDTVHSGEPIIVTIPPGTFQGDPSAWTNQLAENFMVNASVGSTGMGSERGLGSVTQLLADNETSDKAFFRPGSLRGVIFLSDEDDQSVEIPTPPGAGFQPFSGYRCDQDSLVAGNPGNNSITTSLCCSDPLACKYGSTGLTCPTKQVDGTDFKLGVCVDSSQLIPVETLKAQFDQFFIKLDGNKTQDPNYFVVSITPLSAASITAIRLSRHEANQTALTPFVDEADRGDRYLKLGELVGKDSLSMDISSTNYSPILDAIGQKIVEKKSTYTLNRAPNGKGDMRVTILHKDGSATVVPSSEFVIQGKNLVFTNPDFVLSLTYTDQVVINYQPNAPIDK